MYFRSVAAATALVSFSFGLPDTATGQSKTAAISGRVVSAGGDPVAGARVQILNLRKTQATDSVGRFLFADLKPGSYRVEANLLGMSPLSALITVNAGERKDVEFRTDSLGQLLPTIFVEGEPEPQLIRVLTTFERRMAHGHGRFITRDDIEKRNPLKIMDMIRFLPGVRSDCRGFVCQLRLNHDTRGCPPAIFVDDQQTHITVLDNTPPTAIEGIEVYRGPSETPPELNTETARCGGAIAIWTRRGKRHDP
ncbi:MAG: carboxypeptidase regulatory-like domain-containing protein [Gemmatimonadales bacterium]|nr:carboxypeptidase regulatory-like domain-containing protein [Gemmatimonadales bacterium]